MIFERQVYRKINFIKAMFKKYRLFNLPRFKGHRLAVESVYPASVNEIDSSRIDLMNLKCHSNAFIIKHKKIFIELSKCNSCMECKSSGIIFTKIDQVGKILDEKYLPLDR